MTKSAALNAIFEIADQLLRQRGAPASASKFLSSYKAGLESNAARSETKTSFEMRNSSAATERVERIIATATRLRTAVQKAELGARMKDYKSVQQLAIEADSLTSLEWQILIDNPIWASMKAKPKPGDNSDPLRFLLRIVCNNQSSAVEIRHKSVSHLRAEGVALGDLAAELAKRGGWTSVAAAARKTNKADKPSPKRAAKESAREAKVPVIKKRHSDPPALLNSRARPKPIGRRDPLGAMSVKVDHRADHHLFALRAGDRKVIEITVIEAEADDGECNRWQLEKVKSANSN